MTESYICIFPLWDPFALVLATLPRLRSVLQYLIHPLLPLGRYHFHREPLSCGKRNGRYWAIGVSLACKECSLKGGNDLYLASSGPWDMAHPCLFSLLWLDEAMFQNRMHGCHGLIDRTLVATAHEKAEKSKCSIHSDIPIGW